MELSREQFCTPLVTSKLLDNLHLGYIMESQLLSDSVFKEELFDLKTQFKRKQISIDGCNARIEHALKNSIKRIKIKNLIPTI
ncbi:MAG: hypothetical protein JW703_03300 [Candidatus Diapherotrites archaeon]|nr:hypothetical protein [Candidatus Diapherotrites archaeon]